MATEAAIQNKIMKYLEAKGAIVYKTISLSKAGLPDIMGVYKGRHIHFEVKRPGQKPTKLQEFKLSQLQAAGSLGGVATSVEDVQAYFDTLDACV